MSCEKNEELPEKESNFNELTKLTQFYTFYY